MFANMILFEAKYGGVFLFCWKRVVFSIKEPVLCSKIHIIYFREYNDEISMRR